MGFRNVEESNNKIAMKNFLQLSSTDRLSIFEQVSKPLSIQAIEKDWWVTQTLALIFSMQCASHLVFKGGTSLSKAWGLINRLSEDIDLALNRQFLGFYGDISKTQVSKLRKKSFEYISEEFFKELQNKFNEAGVEGLTMQLVGVKDPDQDPLIIEIFFPSILAEYKYIKPSILVETGSRSLIEPFTQRQIVSSIGEKYAGKDFADEPITIPVVNPERTFLEKIFLLHEEFQKPNDKIRVDRLSRHLYDIEKILNSKFAEIAFNDDELYNHIVKHRSKFNGIGGIDYANHSPDKINIIPPQAVLKAWKKDYEAMQENMIYGDSLSFESLIARMEELQQILKRKK
jgi:predicted nucleotidyltransferase component of viral defense system